MKHILTGMKLKISTKRKLTNDSSTFSFSMFNDYLWNNTHYAVDLVFSI